MIIRCAPVAQLDRVPGFEPGGREFESLRARHILKPKMFSSIHTMESFDAYQIETSEFIVNNLLNHSFIHGLA
jgi:hypothetical protein